MTVEVHAIEGLPEVRSGDDLAALLAPGLRALGARAGDVVAVTSKIVSKSEGRLIPGDDRTDAVARETVRVVARRGDLVIAETAHGFVCANAGVDASNVTAGVLALLPEDPDGSAATLQAALTAALGVRVAVVITDTFGRAWREGLVNVAIGCAGMPAVLDLRGSGDHFGRPLEATIVALADEVAAASGLVMAKAALVPAALVRGVTWPRDAPGGAAHDLVRAPGDDLFRESPLQALHARRTIRSFAPGEVPRGSIEEAVRAACTAPAPHTRPWRFTALTSELAQRRLRAAVAEAWRADLRSDGADGADIDEIDARIARSDAVLAAAPVLIVPWLRLDGTHRDPRTERARAERELLLLSGGAAIQTLLLALHAQGLASCWLSSTLFWQEETRDALVMDDGWFALGIVACGRMPEGGSSPPRPPIDPADFLDLA